ncbi:MAG: histidine kinase [Chitinophagaceae bacterium]
MNRKQRLLIYVLTIFMLVWGFDLITLLKNGHAIDWEEAFNIFNICQIVYVTSTLLLTRWVGNRFFSSRRYTAFWLGMAVVVILFACQRYLLEQVILGRLFNTWNYPPSTRFSYYFLDNLYYALIYVLLGFLIYLLDAQLSNQRKQALLLQQTREAELQFLRSQINPHFLFNTLNNIYSLVYEQSARAPEAVLQLSNLLRYMLYEKKEHVPIEKEWGYIDDFITLQQLRFDYSVRVMRETHIEAEGKTIPPYLLIPFIENAFKHGDFRQEPLRLSLTVSNKELLFESSNRIQQSHKDEAGGIGLANVQRRLKLIYPDKHSLQVSEANGYFTVQLHIKL